MSSGNSLIKGMITDGLDVHIQDPTSGLIQYFLMTEDKTDIALTGAVIIDDVVIDVSPGHGFTAAAGEKMVIWENNRYTQSTVKSVSTNAITIGTPSDSAFTVAGATIYRGNINMNVDGSVATGTPTDFLMTMTNFTIPIDISKIIITMFHGTAGDDGRFGGLTPALPNGVYYRKEGSAVFNMGNYTNNQSFKNTGGVVTYTAKGPAGTNATDIVFDIKQIFGQVIRVDARLNDVIMGIVRDNIAPATTLTGFTSSLIGSYTSGE